MLPWIGATRTTPPAVGGAASPLPTGGSGIPERCKQAIWQTSTEDGEERIYQASILEEGCIIPILRAQGKDDNPHRKFTKEDQVTIKNWWNDPKNVPEEFQDDLTDIFGPNDTRFTSQMVLFDKISEYYIGLGVKLEDIDQVPLLSDKVNTGSFVGTPLDSLGDGVNEGLDAITGTLKSVQKILRWISDPFNLLRLTAIVVGVIMVQRGLVRVMSSDRAYDYQGA